MHDFKYIVFLYGDHEVALTFPAFIGHDEMARNVGGKDNVVSAGFFSVGMNSDQEIEVDAWGKSVSLKLKSREVDARLISKSIGTYRPY